MREREDLLKEMQTVEDGVYSTTVGVFMGIAQGSLDETRDFLRSIGASFANKPVTRNTRFEVNFNKVDRPESWQFLRGSTGGKISKHTDPNNTERNG